MLLPLQQSRTFYQWMPIGEGIQNSHPFKPKGGDRTREGSPDPSSQGGQAEGTPGRDTQGIGWHTLTPFLNPNPFHWWYGIENVARVRINGESCMALINNGPEINTIMLSFAKSHSFEVGPLSDLVGRWVTCLGLGNALTWPMGYITIWVQVDGDQGNDEDQIALGHPGLDKLCSKGPCHPGDSHDKLHYEHDQGERHRCPGNALGKCLGGLSFGSLTSYGHSGKWQIAAQESDPSEYNEVVTTKDTDTIDAFLPHVIHVRMGMAHTGGG